MPAYSSEFGFYKPTVGGDDNDWGGYWNTNAELLEEAVGGYVALTISGDTTLTVTDGTETSGSTDQARNLSLKLGGTPAGAFNLTLPEIEKTWIVWNASGQTATIRTTTATATVSLPDGYIVHVFSDGAGTVEAVTAPITPAGALQLRLASAILDTNGNEVLEPTATGSAVNHIGVKNAATGSGPELEAKGDDTNIDLVLTPKGTGAVSLGGALKGDRVTANMGFTPVTDSSSSGAVTFDFSTGNIAKITLSENVTSITLSGASAGDCLEIWITQAAGGYTVSGWPAAVKWSGGGTAPTISATSGAVDIVMLRYDGTSYYASIQQDHQ